MISPNYNSYYPLFITHRSFGLERGNYRIMESGVLSASFSEYWEDILQYGALYCKMLNISPSSSGTSVINVNSLEEWEQLKGLDPNNRPFKIITEEEFYKDLTEEEARKIASEL